ncbi:MAG: hypothetical protein ACK5RL_17855 [Acidimicrobiales bacterium]
MTSSPSVPANGSVRVWDPATGQTTITLAGHTGWVLGVAWSPDGTRIASASDDRSVRVWDPAEVTIELIGAGRGSFAWHPASGRYRWDGEPGGAVWWSIGWRRVELEDLALGGRPPIGQGEPLVPA